MSYGGAPDRPTETERRIAELERIVERHAQHLQVLQGLFLRIEALEARESVTLPPFELARIGPVAPTDADVFEAARRRVLAFPPACVCRHPWASHGCEGPGGPEICDQSFCDCAGYRPSEPAPAAAAFPMSETSRVELIATCVRCRAPAPGPGEYCDGCRRIRRELGGEDR